MDSMKAIIAVYCKDSSHFKTVCHISHINPHIYTRDRPPICSIFIHVGSCEMLRVSECLALFLEWKSFSVTSRDLCLSSMRYGCVEGKSSVSDEINLWYGCWTTSKARCLSVAGLKGEFLVSIILYTQPYMLFCLWVCKHMQNYAITNRKLL